VDKEIQAEADDVRLILAEMCPEMCRQFGAGSARPPTSGAIEFGRG